MAKYLTNSDRVLQSVLQNEKLAEAYPFNPSDYETVDEALQSDNYLVCTIAKIIEGKNEDKTDKQLYNEINNYLNGKI
ncbi:hypothetical protein [Tannerella forsythia]|jgi:hypothetical protein|uniref:Uncharacterized protein n=1 Tax=Tannerella forsythia TaxID=28112 RepID=A0A1D3UXM0_TANFO|nr:hypothetical protein [Tannerella forsythia]MDD7540095.1 hypothetical protein [Bacteroidales bacterium]PDP70082.1 hypothetical protein CLI85_11000 [Tannerella forsythia]SCQ24753.1 hypothetical protein TFUB20_02667 [Tannerella forsythia]